MAIKVKRRTAVEDEVEQDQIYTASKGIFNYIETNRVHLGIGLGALLLAIVLLTSVQDWSSSRVQDGGADVFAGVQTAIAPVGDEALADETTLSFAALSDRDEAVRATVAPLLAEGNTSGAAEFLDGAAAAALGDSATAIERLTAVTETSESASLTAVAAFGLASLQLDAGDIGTARAALDVLSASQPVLTDYIGYEVARMTEATGDIEGAQALYAEYATNGAAPLAPAAQADLVRSAEFRANLLSVVLGQEPSIPEEPSEAAPEGAGE